MGFWSRKRQSGNRYVEPAEFRTGVVVLFDGADWRVSGLNAHGGQVPAGAVGPADLTGERLADAFATSWRRAQQDRATVTDIGKWIALLDEGDPTEA